jgi:hypothetical protein
MPMSLRKSALSLRSSRNLALKRALPPNGRQSEDRSESSPQRGQFHWDRAIGRDRLESPSSGKRFFTIRAKRPQWFFHGGQNCEGSHFAATSERLRKAEAM